MTPLPTRREHETYDLGEFTVRVGRLGAEDANAIVEAVAKAIGRQISGGEVSLGPRHDGTENGWMQAAKAAIAATGQQWPPVVEVFFDRRGKVGQWLNQFLHDAGVLISKVLQGKEVG